MPDRPQRAPEFPDPVLTASLYCAGRLDEAIFRVVAPFWCRLEADDPERLCYVWVMRYGKAGEHLKIRVHGPEALRPRIAGLLEGAAQEYLSGLGAPQGEPVQPTWKAGLPIDAEDETDSDHPDRTLLWTRYRRSHVSLGGSPFLEDDTYAALFTRCLGRACERVLDLRPTDAGELAHRTRQTALLKGLASGLAALSLAPPARADYLLYHRDWLLRFTLVKNYAETGKEGDLLSLFDARAAKMGPSLEPLRHMANEPWSRSGPGEDGPDASWRRALADLLGYIGPLCEDPKYDIDPFARDPVFAPLFKVFHGFANQLGLNLLDEAFAHHLLWYAAAWEGSGPPAVAAAPQIAMEPVR